MLFVQIYLVVLPALLQLFVLLVQLVILLVLELVSIAPNNPTVKVVLLPMFVELVTINTL